MKLFLKGERCHTDKVRHRTPQLRSRPARERSQSENGRLRLQLREKQKMRRIYGVLEAQFRNNFEKAAKMKGITGENLLGTLERRLDSVIYRMGFGTSRAQARQIVRHGHIQVNGRKVNIPSFIVKPGDEVASPRIEQEQSDHPVCPRRHGSCASARSWMDVDRENLKGRIISMPRRDELVQIPINEQLIVELYSQVIAAGNRSWRTLCLR